MKAFALDQYGGPEHVRPRDVPEPVLRDHDVMVEVRAAGVNVLDSKIRDGEFKLLLPYEMPLVLGNDVAGVVSRVGQSVTRVSVGDEVYARPSKDRIGTFAERIAVHEDDVALKPASVTMVEAASLPLVALTAWQALVERAGLKAGQKVFVQAGSGGVGTVAIQLAKHLGAFVATTTSAENADMVRALGADLVIDYKTQDFGEILEGYDVVLNSQGATDLHKSIRVLKPGGRVVSISGPPDPAFARDAGLPWFLRPAMWALSFKARRDARRHRVDYSFLFMRASGAQLEQIGALVDAGVIRPVVDRVFPFAETKEAMAYVDTGRAQGKVVVEMPEARA